MTREGDPPCISLLRHPRHAMHVECMHMRGWDAPAAPVHPRAARAPAPGPPGAGARTVDAGGAPAPDSDHGSFPKEDMGGVAPFGRVRSASWPA